VKLVGFGLKKHGSGTIGPDPDDLNFGWQMDGIQAVQIAIAKNIAS